MASYKGRREVKGRKPAAAVGPEERKRENGKKGKDFSPPSIRMIRERKGFSEEDTLPMCFHGNETKGNGSFFLLQKVILP